MSKPNPTPKILNFILPNKSNTYIEFKRDKQSLDEVLNKSVNM
jgi:hypothetical protein